MAIPAGEEKLASAPIPLVEPTVPLPASVVTFPSAVIFRILLFNGDGSNC